MAIKFLVVDRYESAIDFGRLWGWHRLGMSRYATRESEDIRVVTRLAEVFALGGVINLIKGPGFEEALTAPGEDTATRVARSNAMDFESLVSSGGARWVDA
jgi:hypothetical protein